MPQPRVVLLVDDDTICLAIAESMVKSFGFSTLIARDGFEALAVFQAHKEAIACVVLDIEMPRMDGIATFQQLKQIREDICVIIASGYLGEANMAKLVPLHPAGYLRKPLAYQTFTSMLEKCINR
ncbi:MAG: response regulator [Desulforhopalus sp.]|nr:response regulator [Desulforhopalus sp.]